MPNMTKGGQNNSNMGRAAREHRQAVIAGKEKPIRTDTSKLPYRFVGSGKTVVGRVMSTLHGTHSIEPIPEKKEQKEQKVEEQKPVIVDEVLKTELKKHNPRIGSAKPKGKVAIIGNAKDIPEELRNMNNLVVIEANKDSEKLIKGIAEAEAQLEISKTELKKTRRTKKVQ